MAQRVIITIDDQHAAAIDKVAASLKKAGLKDTQVLSSLGIVSGEVDAKHRSALRKVAGVKAVEDEGEMHAQ
ncbi:MAG: hypothetical protein SFU86_19100 [Pirellulaceae bacterium]|nr:hypothetical protein [Pirellulaceae bacterium]